MSLQVDVPEWDVEEDDVNALPTTWSFVTNQIPAAPGPEKMSRSKKSRLRRKEKMRLALLAADDNLAAPLTDVSSLNSFDDPSPKVKKAKRKAKEQDIIPEADPTAAPKRKKISDGARLQESKHEKLLAKKAKRLAHVVDEEAVPENPVTSTKKKTPKLRVASIDSTDGSTELLQQV
jgi:hypothetical protein